MPSGEYAMQTGCEMPAKDISVVANMKSIFHLRVRTAIP
jgi:hypothetical protein